VKSCPLKITPRCERWKKWSEREKAAVKLWTAVWGGRAVATPSGEVVDAFWTDGRSIIGALEVKTHLGEGAETEDFPFCFVQFNKVEMALWLNSYRITPYLIYARPDQVFWQNLLAVTEFAVWTPRNYLPNVASISVPEPVAKYAVGDMHLLSEQPLFSERSPGGNRYVVPK
jgi:hypothetical protein